MRQSSGGVSLEFIDSLTFPDLVDLWDEAIQLEQVPHDFPHRIAAPSAY